MKKFFVVLLILAVSAGNLFAEFSVGAWGRATFVPLRTYINGNNDSLNKTSAGTEVGWGDLPSFALQFSASGEHIGFISNFDFAAAERDGSLYTWWKPNDLFKLDIGYARWDILRGADITESFQNGKYTGAALDLPDVIFNRFTTAEWYVGGFQPTIGTPAGGKPGAILEITPIPNLYIGAAILTGPGSNTPAADNIGDIYKVSQYAAGYNIDGVGLLRVGYFGTANNVDVNKSNSIGHQVIQGAFKFTAVEGLLVDLGVGYGLQEKRDNLNNLSIGLGVKFATDQFGIMAGFGAWLGGDGEIPGGKYPAVELILNPYVPLSFATIGLGFNFGVELGHDDSSSVGFDLYLQKGFGGGEIKAGVTASILPGSPNPAKQDVVIAIPIELTYSVW